MHDKSLKICAIGRTKILLNSIKFLYENDFDIKLIITSKQSDHDSTSPKDFSNLASEIGAQFIETKNINSSNIQKQLKKFNIDLGISVNNPRLISESTLSLFSYGVLNAHPGDLPKYRGNATPNWAILNGEKKIPITIHFMDDGLDSGPIMTKKFFKIDPTTKILDFYKFAEIEVPKLFVSSLKKILNKNFKTIKQSTNLKNSIRAYPRNKFDGKINWNLSAMYIDRLIRASGDPFHSAYTYYKNKKLFILDSEIEIPKFKYFVEPGQITERKINGNVSVGTKKDFLIIKKIQYDNIVYDKPSELITSIYQKLGMNIEDEIEKILKKLKMN